MSRSLCLAVSALAAALLSACAVGPNYHRPKFDTTAQFKEAGDWKPTEPADTLNKGEWWKIFNDEVLNSLENRVNISNETIITAAANYEESRALVREAESGFWPTLSGSLGWSRAEQPPLGPRNGFSAGGNASWTIDIWGEIRRTVESNKASAQSTLAALAAARLSSQAELAIDYFELRAQDQLQKLLDDTVEAEKLSLKITESRYKYGVAARADVVNAETQLLASQSQQVNAHVQRGILEHAVAVLVGEQPAAFSLAPSTMRSDVPTIPAGVPSALLERRPDIAEQERRMAAANAQIGVAYSAWFPSLTLSGSITSTSVPSMSRLFEASNRVWSFGPELAETLFDGGLRAAQVSAARATYDAQVATYRQTVLSGLQQVEDQIVTLKVLEQQAVIEDKTVKAAREAETLTLNQYKAGTVPYSSVITAQTTRLSAEETALQVLSSRLQASVTLIEAVGGGWDDSQLKN
jgi:NodT family efflux transporter outer membrane factor (OMF) lipoprotein